ncbi:MAG TPA: nucleoside-diphosphate sugar epimerase [Erysipelotrichaceae bacterium]|nr:nucleoside-diphosphate sugar epimerase [Erysipelotrichaceae bacterium]
MQVLMRRSILFFLDIILITLAYFLTFELRFEFFVPSPFVELLKMSFLYVVTIKIGLFAIFGLYNSLWRYVSIDELFKLIIATTLGNVILYLMNIGLDLSIPRSIILIDWIITIFLTGGLRLSYRVVRRAYQSINRDEDDLQRVMIIGAGDAGSMIVRELKNLTNIHYKPVVIVDDDPMKHNSTLYGVPIRKGMDDIPSLVSEYNINEIIVAIPSLGREKLAQIVKIAQTTHCKVKTLPGINEIIDDRVSIKNIRDVSIEDLLGREEIKLKIDEISSYLENRIVLVTGAGGSIGSELCRQIIKFKPKKIILLDIYENNVYDLQQELLHSYGNLNLDVIIASVRDKDRILEVFKFYKPEIVFHAAAHKHVPLMENNPQEAIKNNVFGTLKVAQCAHEVNVKRFVLISTDKAVNPTNVMGATKRVAELIIQAMNQISDTEFVAVRFGNVLGSNGSVIPLFKRQIAYGGPITITHPDITRYFMTIPEAARLVLQAGAIAEGGEIFVLDMGKPVKIIDLAKQLIELSGLEPDVDISIIYTGLRPGEKLYEELMLSEEGTSQTKQQGIFIAKPIQVNFEDLMQKILKFEDEIENKADIIEHLKVLVPTYKAEVLK